MPVSSPADTEFAWVRLSLEPDLKPAMLRSLLARAGSAEGVYALSDEGLAALVGSRMVAQLRGPPLPETLAAIDATLAWAAHPDHHLLALDSAAYPPLLLETPDPPPLLYAVGDLAHLAAPAIAIVGARNATPGGLDNARAFAKALAQKGWCVVSGLAAGIDAAAHEGAMAAGAGGGSTIAVMGTGADIVYPARNRRLAKQIAAQGLLLSEYPLGMPALPHQFPRRNRLVAGLSRGVLIVEAALQSGSLITARLAGDMGREVFAMPGSIHSPLSRGCHALIRQGAKLTETAQDILSELGASLASPGKTSRRLFDDDRRMVQSYRMSQGEAPNPVVSGARHTHPAPACEPGNADQDVGLLQALGHDPVHLDDLQRRTQQPAESVLARLLALELNGAVVRLPGGRYQRRS